MTDTNGMTMYIGPTVRGVARHGATFSGGLPSGLEKLAAAMPIVRNLIVPLSARSDRNGKLRGKAPRPYAMFVIRHMFTLLPLVFLHPLVKAQEPGHKQRRAPPLPCWLPKTYEVAAGKINIKETGILLDQLQIGSPGESDKLYEPEKDYIASFNADGTVTVAVVSTGAAAAETSLKATYTQIDPEAVTYEDVIGSYNVKTKKRTGMELIGRVHQRFGVVPSLLLAPGWSHITAVNLALNAKAQLISSLFTAKVVSDLDTAEGKADGMENVKEYKDRSALSDRNMIVCWPLIGVGDYKYYFSAQLAAHLEYLAASNGGNPAIR